MTRRRICLFALYTFPFALLAGIITGVATQQTVLVLTLIVIGALGYITSFVLIATGHLE